METKAFLSKLTNLPSCNCQLEDDLVQLMHRLRQVEYTDKNVFTKTDVCYLALHYLHYYIISVFKCYYYLLQLETKTGKLYFFFCYSEHAHQAHKLTAFAAKQKTKL